MRNSKYIPPTNLLLLAAKQKPYKKVYLVTKNSEKNSGKKVQENGQGGRKSNRIRQKNKKADSKVESNDGP